jgi:hypothetical protein
VLDGCDERALAYDELFDGVGLVAARPGAYERLASTGVPAVRFALCGPAVAIASAHAAAAAIDADEWRLDEHDGVVLVTNRAERATNFDRTPVAAPVHVLDDGKAVTWPSAR